MHGSAARRFLRSMVLLAGFATLIATSSVSPSPAVTAQTKARAGIRIELTDGQAAGSSSVQIASAFPSDASDGGAPNQIAVRQRGSSEVLGYDGLMDWHRLCPSVASCVLEFEFDWPSGFEGDDTITVSIAGSREASGPICESGEDLAPSAALQVTPL